MDSLSDNSGFISVSLGEFLCMLVVENLLNSLFSSLLVALCDD